ncbi:probable histone acetyltransferase HAC-like 1 [Aegilops tauschii subsp. strangulata]|uniref:probable histone acetyltransferase HAC-like 1 n=1 Tax=Aegilops tauschii subsp. strangulata TaxID=200361 RepID=UPI003CC86250
MPQRQSQMQDATGLHAGVDNQFVMLRNSTREKIFEYIERKQPSAIWRGWLPELARRLEEVLFREYPNKAEYYNMMRGPILTHLRFAMNLLSVQNQQQQQNLQLSRQITCPPRNGTMIVTPGVTHGTSENSGMSHVTGNIGPLSFGADMVPLNANMGTLLPGEAPDEHVNTLMSMEMSPTHHDRPRACNNNLVIDTVDTPATNGLLKPRVPVKEARKEPKFSCPVCMNELVDASSTICGHIFCQNCIEASIQAQSKCPTCRRTLTRNSFHRVYLPTMD